jgi:hypothetical protein
MSIGAVNSARLQSATAAAAPTQAAKPDTDSAPASSAATAASAKSGPQGAPAENNGPNTPAAQKAARARYLRLHPQQNHATVGEFLTTATPAKTASAAVVANAVQE